jgi:hypothetical protein
MDNMREYSAPPEPAQTSGYAIASLVLGIVGLVAVPFIASILAIVFGRSARRQINADSSLKGGDYARAGVILGWVGLGLALIGIVLALVLLAAVGSGS